MNTMFSSETEIYLEDVSLSRKMTMEEAAVDWCLARINGNGRQLWLDSGSARQKR